MIEINKIFLGHTPTKNAQFIRHFLEKNNTYDKIIIPCVGEFTLPFIAFHAGYDPKKIYTSDISLFSSLCGYFYANKSIDELEVKINNKPVRGKEDIYKIAKIMVKMKKLQLNRSGKNYYEENIKNEYIKNSAKYEKQVVEILRKNKEKLNNINYKIEDMRKVIKRNYNKKTLFIINPPAYKGGYEKMYDFRGQITWNKPLIEMMDWGEEIKNLYLSSEEKKSTYLWFFWKRVNYIDEKKYIYLNKKNERNYYYWVLNKHNSCKRIISRYDNKNYDILNYKQINSNYTLSNKSKISFIEVDKATGLYFRDLYVKKMKDTESEIYLLMLIDGLVFGSIGIHRRDLTKDRDGRLCETFGFNKPLEKYPNANRLLMMAITCRDFAAWIESRFKKGLNLKVKELHTTCLSKYRKLKINNNLLKIEKREKLGTLYKIKYYTEIYDRTYEDVIKLYLEEINGR